MKKQTLRPLTPQEQAVAAQNHDLVFRFLRAYGLPQSEYYDVVIFRYLLTVENWFRRPELYRYQFSTIAWRAMSSALHNEQKKNAGKSRPSASTILSLEAKTLPGARSLRRKIWSMYLIRR